MSTTRHEIMSPPAFHGPSKGHRTLRKCSAFPTVEPHLQINWFRGKTLLSRKDNSTQTFRRRHRVCLCYHQDPNPGSGILTWFPFDRWRKELHSFNTEFPYLLGSTNPCPIAVHMEPFSTSVFKVLNWIFATTTKICTRGRFNWIHIQILFATSTPAYSLMHRIYINGRVSVARFSVIHFQG